MTEQPKAGELLVGAYLRVVENCELVMYNQRSSRQGAQLEIDVIGVKEADGGREIFVCEVITHLGGVRYGTIDESLRRFRKKLVRNKGYIIEIFGSAESYRFQFWSPVVTVGLENRLPELVDELGEREDMELEFVINGAYGDRITELREKAGSTTKRHGELGFRILQILEHLR